jgi:hypothetical protein
VNCPKFGAVAGSLESLKEIKRPVCLVSFKSPRKSTYTGSRQKRKLFRPPSGFPELPSIQKDSVNHDAKLRMTREKNRTARRQ